jgi:hypothetical protein
VTRVQCPNNEELWIIFSHDEFQRLTDVKQLNQLRDGSISRKSMQIYNHLVAAMELSTHDTNSSPIFIFNLFSGTFPLGATTLLAPFMYQLNEISLPPMPPSDGLKALRRQYPDCPILNPDHLDYPSFQKFFQLCGKIPRIWVTVGEVIKDYKTFTHQEMLELLSKTVSLSKSSYLIDSYFTPLSLTQALFVMIQKYDLDAALRSQIKGLKEGIQTLLYNGSIFLDSKN